MSGHGETDVFIRAFAGKFLERGGGWGWIERENVKGKVEDKQRESVCVCVSEATDRGGKEMER